MTPQYPKRLIEIDLPIKRISAHARREKSIRHGHISTLHIWWARRPLAACRAVICAALWPDPADPLCPQAFRDKASKVMNEFATAAVTNRALGESCDRQTWVKWQALVKTGGFDSGKEAHWNVLRFALLDFVADFANWDNSSVREYLEASRTLTQAAHEALGGEPGTRPLVVDPFAGGGSIPLEALRVGADAFASDLNPIPVLLNKVVLQYIPRYGQRLAEEVRKWGEWIQREAEKELAEFYPKDVHGATPIAYLWARTIQCEGPGCGAELPLLRSLWLAKKGSGAISLTMVPNAKERRVEFDIIVKNRDGWFLQSNQSVRVQNPSFDGTVKRGSATCPCCGFTTPVTSLRRQLKARKGGTRDARMLAVRQDSPDSGQRSYRLPIESDINAVRRSQEELVRRKQSWKGQFSLVPDETISLNEVRRLSVPLYGMTEWGDVFSPRQALALTTFIRLVRLAGDEMGKDSELTQAVKTCLSLAVDRLADFNSSICVLNVVGGRGVVHTFGRQALPMVWDFMETNPFNDVGANWIAGIEALESTIKTESLCTNPGHVACCSAAHHVLPSACAQAMITDPPYYDSVPYAYLSDFFYVWLKRSLGEIHPDLLTHEQVPKEEEIVVDRPHELSTSKKDIGFYERELVKAFSEGRRILRPDGIGTIVFASKTTASWEAVLQAIIDAGLIITGSWPIDTEREARLAAQGQARLASSVHIVIRPREKPDGSVRTEEIGDWRDLLQELPRRIHDWMPRLAEEGVVGADAIFACLGPALEIFSRYSRVEKASGEPVALREYLEHVWATVAKEALAMVFKGADATGFEADARLTAMWLWTLKSPDTNESLEQDDPEENSEDESETKKARTSGFTLEYDAARKIAQGLGADMESLSHLVEIVGDQGRLLPVSERTRHLFGKNEEEPTRTTGLKKRSAQLDMFAELTDSEDGEAAWKEKTVKRVGDTTLDRLHQGMILFAAGRGEALKRFVVEDGVGRDGKFWRLAQALSALYPSGSDEKRWVDGVLARKKQFGF
jgi:adenine-specific DNA methylase